MNGRIWRAEEDARLEALLDSESDYRRIGQILGRPSCGVVARRRLLGIPAPLNEHPTVSRTAKLLGVRHETVARWIQDKRLTAHLVGHRVRKMQKRVCYWEDICAFLENEDNWHLVDPGGIADSGLREWATEIRHGLVFLTSEQAARILHVTSWMVLMYARRGCLRSVRIGNLAIAIRSDWLQDFQARGFTPQSKHPGHDWTEEEDRYLREHRPTNYVIDLARSLMRPKTSVYNRCKLLGLTGPLMPQSERRHRRRLGFLLPDQETFIREWAHYQTPRHLAIAINVSEDALSDWMLRQRLPRDAPAAHQWDDMELEAS